MVFIVNQGNSQTLNVPDVIGTSSNAGNVGIGTTTPNAKLEVKVTHALNQDEEIRIGSYTSGKFYGLGLNYRLSSVGTPTNHLVAYNGNIRNTAMTFIGDKVGIGTSSLYSKFNVVGQDIDFYTTQVIIHLGLDVV